MQEEEWINVHLILLFLILKGECDMGQAYKIDRLNSITYKGKKKKVVKSLRCRYMAKSQVVNCNAQSQTFEFVNFRGSHFKKVNFKNAVFYGCDF